MLLHMTIH